MCDPITLGISAALAAGGAVIKGNESANAAKREAEARNAVLKANLVKQQSYAADNAKELEGNVAHYAPGAQEAQLADAQGKRTAMATGNISMTDPNSIPITADAPPAVKSEIAKRMLAVHDGAIERAKLNAKPSSFGDTWLQNNLNTANADRNIGVTNNYSQGAKDILTSQQDAAAASVYKPPSIWGTLATGASSIAAGAAGAGKGISMPKIDVSSVWNPIAGVTGQ